MLLTVPWWAWAIVALCIALAELHAPGYYLIWITAGAALTAAIGTLWDLSIPVQIAAFAAASVLSCVGGYFVYRSLNRPVEGDLALNQRNLHMIGAQGVVCVAIMNGHGKVRMGDSVWLAEGPNLPAGTPIIVKSVRSTSLIVGTVDR